MSKKSKHKRDGLVYSTNPDYNSTADEENTRSGPQRSDRIRVVPEKKGRGGKTVTIIKGYRATAFQLSDLAKQLKQYCGVGGSVKNGEIMLQGDHVDKVVAKMKTLGFIDVKRAGG